MLYDSSSYPGTGNIWTDSSGFGNDLTMTGISYNNSVPNSLVFNGATNYASRKTFTRPPTNIFSIGVWVRFFENVNPRYILAFGRDIGGSTGGMALFAYGFNAVSRILIFELGSGVGRVSSGIIPDLNTWYHIFATANETHTRLYTCAPSHA